MSSSPKEEKLRLKMQKLFKKHEFSELSATGKNSIGTQCNDVNNMQKTNTPGAKQTKKTNSQLNKGFAKRVKNLQQSQKMSVPLTKDEPKSIKVDPLKTKDAFGLKKCKQKDSELERTQNSTSTKTNDNNMSQQKNQSNNKKLKDSQKHENIRKQSNVNLKLKKSANKNLGDEIKKSEKSQNINLKNFTHVSHSDQTMTINKSDIIENGNKTIDENRKRKAKSHTAIASNKKKTKKADKETNKPTKSNQKQNTIPVQLKDKSKVKPMKGSIRDEDFDSGQDERDMKSKNKLGTDDAVMKKSKNNYNGQCDHVESSDSDGDYFPGDEFNEFYYEEDEDSYDCFMDSDNDFFTSYDDYYNDMSYSFNESYSDDDYKLPKGVLEDLIIRKGTAKKYDLKPEDNVSFNSENEDCQILDIEEKHTVKKIYQPKVYTKEELLKLKYNKESSKSKSFQCKKDAITNNSENCPKLIPINDNDGVQQYKDYKEEEQSMDEYEFNSICNESSIVSISTEVTSDEVDSFYSEDINDKYLNSGEHESDNDKSIDEDIWIKKHNPDIIDARGIKCEKNFNISSGETNINLNDDAKETPPSVKLCENVDLNTENNILYATIIDKKIFESNGNNKDQLCGQYIKTQNTPLKEAGLKSSECIATQSNARENSTKESLKYNKPFGKRLLGYNTKFFNALESNCVLVLIKDPFYIYGTVRLILLAGTVELYGHSLILNREVEVFSPRGCSMIEISSSKQNNITKEGLSQILKGYENHFALVDLKRIVKLYNCETDALVLLKRNEARKKVVQQFKKFMNENVFPNINNINMDHPLYSSEYILRCMIYTFVQVEKCLRLPTEWRHFSLTSKSCVMLAGGKSVGKSTLLRYLINRHLPQHTLLIDLDIGQPEIFVPQTISCAILSQPLLGPGFMLNLQPELSYTVGHTNVTLCADKYIVAMRSLIAHCKAQKKYKGIPWIVNTMGYNKGFGLELISIIAQELPLTDVIQLQSNKDINNFDSILHPHVLSSVPKILFSEKNGFPEKIPDELNYRLHVWQSAVEQETRYQKDWSMSPKDLRFATLLARLSDALQGHADWLTDVKPVSASFNELKIINLMAKSFSHSVEDLTKSIEANLVYLCHFEEDSKPLKCLGIGVVRAVDFIVQQLYLIPALPYSQLKYVNSVAIGEMPLPTSVFTNQGPKVKNKAPFVYNTIEANASKAIKQIYHRPQKFRTGKYKSFV